jgi:hypothetical protein
MTKQGLVYGRALQDSFILVSSKFFLFSVYNGLFRSCDIPSARASLNGS